MKKILAVLLAVMCFAGLVACNTQPEAETLKFGFGVYTNVSKASDATEDVDGVGKVAVTGAVITVDKDGKIVSCVLDTAEAEVKYTANGEAVAVESFLTKYEKGDNYNMVAWGGAQAEWYAQADAFMALVKGKTLSEIKALVAEGNKGTSEVINAGCTIMINEFVGAIEKAYANLVDSNVTANDTLKLGVSTALTSTNATEEKDGKQKVETTLVAAAVDANGKIVATTNDCVQVEFTFTANGASTYDLTKAAASKREKGDNYNMVAWGGASAEWYAQADAFAALCVGKNVADVEALMGSDNYGTADVKGAGCTILVDGFVKATAKIK